jgi:type IV secretion system protein VirD4
MKLNITPALRKYVLPNIPYALIFWFADKLGMAYRLAPGSDMLSKIIGSMKTLSAAITSPFPSFVPFDLMIDPTGTGTFIRCPACFTAKTAVQNCIFAQTAEKANTGISPVAPSTPKARAAERNASHSTK